MKLGQIRWDFANLTLRPFYWRIASLRGYSKSLAIPGYETMMRLLAMTSEEASAEPRRRTAPQQAVLSPPKLRSSSQWTYGLGNDDAFRLA